MKLKLNLNALKMFKWFKNTNKYERVYGRWRDPPPPPSAGLFESRSELKGRHWCRRLGFLVHLIGTQKKRSQGKHKKAHSFHSAPTPPPPHHPPPPSAVAAIPPAFSPLRQRDRVGQWFMPARRCTSQEARLVPGMGGGGRGGEGITGMKLMEFWYNFKFYLNPKFGIFKKVAVSWLTRVRTSVSRWPTLDLECLRSDGGVPFVRFTFFAFLLPLFPSLMFVSAFISQSFRHRPPLHWSDAALSRDAGGQRQLFIGCCSRVLRRWIELFDNFVFSSAALQHKRTVST